MPRQISWLHVSDFHIREGDPYDRNLVLGALINSVHVQRVENGRQPDLIFATGDIANSGATGQYADATQFFDRLLDATGLDRTRLFVIPGNHDVDRIGGSMLRRTLETVQESHAFFGSADRVRLYVQQKQRAFHDWYNTYFDGIRVFTDTTTCQPPVELEMNRLKVVVSEINSALFCQGDDDNGRLWIGRRCLDPVADAVRESDADIRVALIHHPLDWLHDGEQENVEALLQDSHDIILRGHLHRANVQSVVGTTGASLRLACGAAYQGSNWPNRVLYGTARFDDAVVAVYPICYKDQPRPLWTVDTSVFPNREQHGFEGDFLVEWKKRPQRVPQVVDTDYEADGDFYDEGRIRGLVTTEIKAPSELVRRTLKLYRSTGQRIWLIATNRRLFLVIDDEDKRRNNQLIQWNMMLDDAEPVKAYDHPDMSMTGQVDIGQRRYWLYSQDLHPNPRQLEEAISAMVAESQGDSRPSPL